MARIHSFPPVCSSDAQVLILGSMPGRLSLERQQYYAHPRNAFWWIATEIFGFAPDLDYSERTGALIRCKIALWDVLDTCERSSSLDSDIVEASIVPNDLAGFLAEHGEIRLICFNGSKAEQAFTRHVLPRLDGEKSRVRRVRLPSTSPAHASMTPEQKLGEWRTAIAGALQIIPLDPAPGTSGQSG